MEWMRAGSSRLLNDFDVILLCYMFSLTLRPEDLIP